MAAKKFKYEEFLAVYQKVLTEVTEGTYDDILEGVRVFDKEGNGTVMGAEIRHVLRTLGEKLTPNEISSVMDGQEDMNGSLNVESKFSIFGFLIQHYLNEFCPSAFCKYLIDGKKEEK
uniref:Myosin light chain 3, skeletal muscle isoform n=1 Tax=Phallusia mammillata TaxID=59560 RepID=A0A6F9DMB2_9ASCI|nr:myosin light chain 3, skeletal muscle isoform [Phallusia mammillata]